MRKTLEELSDANIKTLINTGTTLKNSIEGLNLVKTINNIWNKNAYCTIGIHPHHSSNCSTDTINKLRKMSENKEVVAIGETGLDYNRMKSSKKDQLKWFYEHVKLAVELKLPMFLHEREAHKDLLEVLDKFTGRLPPIVIHCFTGTADEAKNYIDRGFYIGLTTFIAKQKRGLEGRNILKQGIIPLNRIMIETDGPYMLPDLPKELLKYYTPLKI